MKTLYFGDVSVDKVIDGIERFPALNAFPDIDMELFDQNIEWMHSFYEPASKMILLSMHSYLIRTKTLNILVDTCIGNNKHRVCLLYTSPSPRDQRGSRMPSSA